MSHGIYVKNFEIVITGDPDHNCDQMGCGLEHVLYRSFLSVDQAKVLSSVFPTGDREKKETRQPSEARLKAMQRQREAGNDIIFYGEID